MRKFKKRLGFINLKPTLIGLTLTIQGIILAHYWNLINLKVKAIILLIDFALIWWYFIDEDNWIRYRD